MSQEKFKTENFKLQEDLSLTGQTNVSPTDKLLGTILDNKIQIQSLIGKGGMSVVYKGTHLVLNCPVAVKVLTPNLNFNEKALLRLQQEAKSAYSLSHQNLASVHDVSLTADGLAYLVMDFAGGEPMSEMLLRGPLEPTKAIEIFSQICAGLRAAHAQGVIHRDIKPGNIMVEHLANGSELVKIVDFGIAKKVTENADEIQKLTQTGEVFGTPLYMSPEQCRGDKLDERSDIYSMGCVFYEALTGSPPFKGESSIATIMEHLSKEAPTPDVRFKVPQPLLSVLHRCLEKDSKDRYQSMDELYKDLQLIKDGGNTAKRYVKKSQSGKPRKAVVALALLACGLIMFIALGAILSQRLNPYFGYETIADCSNKISKNPDDGNAYVRRANLNMQEHEFTKAVADYTDCLRLGKYREEIYADRANAYLQMKRYKEAVSDCNSSIALVPNTFALYYRAIAYSSLHDYAHSLADADAYIKQHSPDVTILCTRANALIAMGRYKEGIDTCTRAIEIDPGNAASYTDRANAYNFLHQSEKAIADATEAVRLNRDPRAYIVRARARVRLHQYDQAISDLDTALQLEPNSILALTLKARALAETGKFDQALSICSQAVAIRPQSVPALTTRAEIYKRMGKIDLAEQDLQKLKLINPTMAGTID